MYGSYAKGYATPDSDIDVAVIVPPGIIVDKWHQWAEDSPLYREVMRTGVAV